jgi:hypothetical protein
MAAMAELGGEVTESRRECGANQTGTIRRCKFARARFFALFLKNLFYFSVLCFPPHAQREKRAGMG